MGPLSKISSLDFTCKGCKNPLKVFLPSLSYSLVCPHCGIIYENHEGKIIPTTLKFKNGIKPTLPIGTTGKLKGKKYIITSAVLKKEKGTNYKWEEYTLFNPVHGYANLAQYNGHWTFLETLNEIPEKISGDTSYRHAGTQYDLYSKYKSEIISAEGEFSYKIENTYAQVEEYIAPPYILSIEKTGLDYVWFKGEYIVPDDIRNGFNVAGLPPKHEVGAIEPFFSKIHAPTFKNVCLILAALMTLSQFYFHYSSHDETAFMQTFVVTDSLHNKEIITKSFDLKYGTKNVDVKLSANVDNNWAYAGIALVNEANGDLYDLDLEAFYYHGYESGESWSEGIGWQSKVISQVPEGKYHLIITPQKPATMSETRMTVTLTRDVGVMSNFVIVTILLAIFPIYYFKRKDGFEKDRWYNSSYSPYEYDEGYE